MKLSMFNYNVGGIRGEYFLKNNFNSFVVIVK